MISATRMNGIFLYSDNNKMGLFIIALREEDKEDIYDTVTKVYEDWMCCENDSEDYAIGDWVMKQLAIAGFEKEEDYYMLFDSDWD